jgi:lipoate-protein ligase A
MDRLRVIDTDLADPAFTAAVDEVILETAMSGRSPTLHLYRRSPPGVTLGYFQKAEENVDLDFCRENDIKVVRRMSGGGVIYTDERQLVYGLAAKDLLPEAPSECFELVCGHLAEALSGLGCDCTFSPENDVLCGGRKVSGSAIVNKGATKLIHGTVMVEIDRIVMFQALKVPKERLEAKGIEYPGQRVTSLVEAVGRPLPMEAVKGVVVNAIQASTGLEAALGELTIEERDRAKELVLAKYGDPGWNLKF